MGLTCLHNLAEDGPVPLVGVEIKVILAYKELRLLSVRRGVSTVHADEIEIGVQIGDQEMRSGEDPLQEFVGVPQFRRALQHQLLKVLTLFSQFILRPFTLCGILRNVENLSGLPVVICQGRCRDLHVSLFTVLVVVQMLGC
jgi:hypothetical protein